MCSRECGSVWMGMHAPVTLTEVLLSALSPPPSEIDPFTTKVIEVTFNVGCVTSAVVFAFHTPVRKSHCATPGSGFGCVQGMSEVTVGVLTKVGIWEVAVDELVGVPELVPSGVAVVGRSVIARVFVGN